MRDLHSCCECVWYYWVNTHVSSEVHFLLSAVIPFLRIHSISSDSTIGISSIMINEYCSLLPVHQKIGRRWWGSAKSCTPFFGVKKKGVVIGGRRCFPPQGLHPNYKFSPQHVLYYYYLPYTIRFPPLKILRRSIVMLFPPVLHTIESNTPLPREKFPDLEWDDDTPLTT